MSVHVLPFALWHEAQPLKTPPLAPMLPGLSRWLGRARADTPTRTGDALQPSLSLPHEHAQAQALGWPVVDGLLPWAAQAACDAGWAVPGDGSAWGIVSLCHWQVSHGLATLTDPDALVLSEVEDQTLFDAMQPFFAEDGLRLHRWRVGHWLVSAPALAQLPTAALARVIGEDVDAWLVGGDAPDATARVWRRLQNEMQMLLYTHPVNERRMAHNELPVNSFWVSGAGILPTEVPVLPEAEDALQPHLLRQLATAAQREDWQAWLTAWNWLDDAVFAPLLQRHKEGKLQRLRITLCSERRALTWNAAPVSLFQKAGRALRPSRAATILKAL